MQLHPELRNGILSTASTIVLDEASNLGVDRRGLDDSIWLVYVL
jgi:hypothetical protein